MSARIKPGTAAAVFGGVVGLAIGCAYLGGTMAKSQSIRTQAERLNSATSAGFTEEALVAAAGGLDESALSIARRHDPYIIAGGAQRDRQAALMTARLELLRKNPSGNIGLRQASLGTDPARPFQLANALDSSRDLECLTQAAYYEARGEGREGMQAVTQVVLNRVRHRAFPNTICGVVYQGAARRTGCQFSFTCNGTMRGRVNAGAWNRASDVASSALSGRVFAKVGIATHFHTTNVSPRWRNTLINVGQVGDHVFYKFGGRSGSNSSFNYVPSRTSNEPRAVLASLDPSESVRQAGQVISDALQGDRNETTSAQTERPYLSMVPAPANTGELRLIAASLSATSTRPTTSSSTENRTALVAATVTPSSRPTTSPAASRPAQPRMSPASSSVPAPTAANNTPTSSTN